MVIIGIDAHKATHTMVAVDGMGAKLGQRTVPARTEGHRQALRWAHSAFGSEVTWAVEDVRPVTRLLEQELIDAGQTVVRVPTWLMARVRGKGRSSPGKSDPIDALAVARSVLQEFELPTAHHDAVSRECKLLVSHRDRQVKQRNGAISRLFWYMHELDPDYDLVARRLYTRRNREALNAWLLQQHGPVARLALDELSDVGRLTDAARHIESDLADLAEQAAPNLLTLPGCGPVLAARIVGIAANVTRFRDESAFARFAGVGPKPNWSGSSYGRMRPYVGGNRQLNAALHHIAMVQIRDGHAGDRYYRKRVDEGDSAAKARRSLKRRLARVVFTRLRADYLARNPSEKVQSQSRHKGQHPGG